jgi:hypothetical protein
MIRLLRILGVLMIVGGALVILSYIIAPLRYAWTWFLRLPIPIQISLGVAGAGLLLLLGTLIWERLEEREADRELLKDDLLVPDDKQREEEQ